MPGLQCYSGVGRRTHAGCIPYAITKHMLRMLRQWPQKLKMSQWNMQHASRMLKQGHQQCLPVAGDGKPATLVLTDVESSTELWEWDRVTMMEAISIHDKIMRANLSQYCGYEVHVIMRHAVCTLCPAHACKHKASQIQGTVAICVTLSSSTPSRTATWWFVG